MALYYLLFAILAEILATSMLKLTKGFTQLWPTVLCSLIYMVCHYYFAKAIEGINLGIAYALWCGLGIVATALVSYFIYREQVSLMGVLGMALILSGCLLVHLGGK